ncbi:hypothetical protein DFP72DRAFT_852649 [Ephemerocybe angulata]|uniref:Uncharacterized protein n=1 Tax=Ephemerocybe angulata TaxID=980116 RepID=A0A8H6M2I1_9AGAR|nr:hypothetical protein DFP72DRAFT_852649 [Tulosesus angulatus]
MTPIHILLDVRTAVQLMQGWAMRMGRMVGPSHAFGVRSPSPRTFVGLLREAGPVGVSGSWGMMGDRIERWRKLEGEGHKACIDRLQYLVHSVSFKFCDSL